MAGAVMGLVAALALAPGATAAARPASDANLIPEHYVVVYENSVGSVSAETDRREGRLGFKSKFRYRRALKGFAAKLNRAQVRAVRSDPDVAYVAEDRTMQASSRAPTMLGDDAPTGTRRIGAATARTAEHASDTGVAVIDTGVDLTHPDLDVSNGTDCTDPGTTADDDQGHGTHVAGSIAAKNNGSGVVGVAPGTKIWAVKVLDSTGNGSLSSVVCGIDWVTANAVSKNIKVLNMSLGGSGEPVQACETTTDPMHQAVCRAAAGDVLSVVAAGNDGWDFDYASSPDVPAAYPQALTVTALSDTDGRSGGTGGPPACRTGEADDAPASFSNFAATSAGAAHTIAAPGTCITSTWPTDVAPSGGYTTISGTSMAAPHIAGAAALCENDGGVAGACAGKTPAEVISSLRATAQSHTTRHPAYGFTYDPAHTPQAARYFGYLAVVDTAAPDTEISGGPSGVTASSSASFSFSSTEEGSSFECRLDSGGWESCSSPTSVAGLSEGSHVYSVRAKDGAGNSDASEATRSFTVDTTAPDTSITAGPSGTISSSSASFSFSATEANSSFECKLDAGSWAACSSPTSVAGLSEGPHTFSVRAKDGAGNTDASEATRSFTVDTTAPDTSITAGPSGTISSSSASFSFSATEAGSDFECKLDAGGWVACSSPKELTGLSEGPHTFSVRAKDAAGNTDASEATRSFTVDTTPPPPPDSDGDGVPDASDRCPTVAGSTAGGGCPAPAPAPAPALSPTPIIPPTTAPSNSFRFTGGALVKRRLTILTLTVPGPGVVTAAQAGTTGTRVSARKPLIKPVRVTADVAGQLKLRIKPSKAGKQRVRKKGSFSVKLKITYTPKGGTPRSSTRRVKMKR